VFEGNGRVKEYAGGYDDWLRQRAADTPRVQVASKPAGSTGEPGNAPPAARPRKLSYREQQELAGLPARIETLEEEQAELHARMAEPGFFKRPGGEIAEVNSRLAALSDEIAAAYARWEELESA
jgi:ATP-binding cassette subfamily F protein uup